MYLETRSTGNVQIVALRIDAGDTIADLGSVKRILRDSVDTSRRTVLDLAEVDFLNSTAIGALVGATRLFTESGGCLVLTGLGTRLAETFRIVRLDRVVAFRETIEKAVAALSATPPPDYHRLVRENPSIEDVKRAFQERRSVTPAVDQRPSSQSLLRLAQGVYGNQHAPTDPLVEDESAGEGYTEADTAEVVWNSTPDLRRERLVDWNDALMLFTKARRLSRRHMVDFDPNMSFAQFLAQMADRLGGAGSVVEEEDL